MLCPNVEQTGVHSVPRPKPKPQAKSRKPQRGVAAVALGFLVTAGLAGLYRVEDVRPSVLQCMSVISPYLRRFKLLACGHINTV